MPPPRVLGTDDSPRLFVTLWGLAVAFHQFWLNLWISSPLDAALTTTALLSACNPSSTRLFLLLTATHLTSVTVALPYGWNHELLAVIVELHLAAVALRVWWTRRLSPPLAEVFPLFAPAARTAYVTMYLLATLHKLNSDFVFDTSVSCGAYFYHRFVRRYPALEIPPVLQPEAGAIAFTLASEALIPILLMFGRTRPVGAVWAAAFHTLVGLTLNTDFSVFAFAFITLFLAPRLPDAWARRAGARIVALRRLVPGLRVPAGVRAAMPLALVPALAPLVPVTRAHNEMVQLVWLPLAAAFVAVLAFSAWARVPAVPGDGARIGLCGWLQWTLQFFLLFLGLSPYIGFRTEGSFAMFSNLRTEGGRTNHLVMPLVPLFRHQEDLVTVVATDDRELLRRTNFRTRRLVFFEFQKLIRTRVAQGHRFTLTYRRRGKLVGPTSAEEVVRHLRDYNVVENKLLWFRSVPREGRRNYCQH